VADRKIIPFPSRRVADHRHIVPSWGQTDEIAALNSALQSIRRAQMALLRQHLSVAGRLRAAIRRHHDQDSR
jgi:hypothetical protein